MVALNLIDDFLDIVEDHRGRPCERAHKYSSNSVWFVS